MAVTPEEYVGPMTPVEVLCLHGEANRHDKDIQTLKETLKNLESSIRLKRQELAAFQGRKEKVMVEILRGRGKVPGLGVPIREVERPNDGTVWIVTGGQPEA
jgi:hypothetical protein